MTLEHTVTALFVIVLADLALALWRTFASRPAPPVAIIDPQQLAAILMLLGALTAAVEEQTDHQRAHVNPTGPVR